MDPKLAALIQAKRQQMGQQGPAQAGGPQAGPGIGHPMFDQNPFAAILGGQAQAQPGKMSPQGTQQSSPQPQSLAGQGQSGAGDQSQYDPAQDATQPGSNPGATKPLLVALQALHNFITEASDPSDIATIRSCMSLITRLIAADQQRQGQNDQQSQQAAAQPQYPTAQPQ